MHPRAADLIATLQLVPHPEGGYYREIHRARQRVQPLDDRSERSAMTTIYFLLTSGDVSRWHRVASDEAWHFHEGDPLELFTLDEQGNGSERYVVGPMGTTARPIHVVTAGTWQAARTTGSYTLVGCTVGPGFDFADFEMLRDRTAEAHGLRARHPETASLL